MSDDHSIQYLYAIIASNDWGYSCILAVYFNMEGAQEAIDILKRRRKWDKNNIWSTEHLDISKVPCSVPINKIYLLDTKNND